MKKSILVLVILISIFFQLNGQQGLETKYALTISTVKRDAEAILTIINNADNSFSGSLNIDGSSRAVYGWYTKHISEGGAFKYNTDGIIFYCDLGKEFQHQQLFKGLFNFDKSAISGTYFYWGNEFNFHGIKK